MNCNICKIPLAFRQVVCDDCDEGKNFWKIFKRKTCDSKLGVK